MKKQSVTITGENLNVVVNHAAEAAIPFSDARIKSKAEMRIAALKAKGVDTSCYFPLGSDKVIKIEDGNAIPVDMTDEVEKKMVEGGYINHYALFRRWVMAQMFRILREYELHGTNITRQIQKNGYEYSWRMLERELNAQSKMFKHGDMENFSARSNWFGKSVIIDMADHYVGTLKGYIGANLMFRANSKGQCVYKHTCKGNPYVRFRESNIFVSDLQKKVYAPLESIIREIAAAHNVEELSRLVRKFNSMRKKMKWDTKMSQSFIDAYKGSGAYFTCKNLILFHGAAFRNEGILMGQKMSLVYLEKKAQEYHTEGWRMIGVMKQLIEESNISISGKISEWRK